MIRALAAVIAVLTAVAPAFAQHDHAAGHDVYQHWQNQRGELCCNGQDCGALEPVEVRNAGDHLEVRVEGQWCPVAPWMAVTNKKSPDWTRAHACVWPDWSESGGTSPCSRLKCFQPEALF
ncbi:MAG: hypothetical protein AB7F39_06665 [Variibacter sp.]